MGCSGGGLACIGYTNIRCVDKCGRVALQKIGQMNYKREVIVRWPGRPRWAGFEIMFFFKMCTLIIRFEQGTTLIL